MKIKNWALWKCRKGQGYGHQGNSSLCFEVGTSIISFFPRRLKSQNPFINIDTYENQRKSINNSKRTCLRNQILQKKPQANYSSSFREGKE